MTRSRPCDRLCSKLFLLVCQNQFFISTKPKSSIPRSYEENIIFVYDLIFDILCITTPVLDKYVKSIMEGMFTNMGRSPNYDRNNNIFHITNGLNSLHRKWYTGNQYMVKSAENRMRSNLEGCRTFRNLVVSYLDWDVSYRGKNV